MVFPDDSSQNDLEKAKFLQTLAGLVAVRTSQTTPHAGPSFYQFNNLLTGGTDKEMNKDGSVTPVDFTFSPGAGVDCYVKSLSISIEHKGKMDADAFGTIVGGLTNGLLISVQSEGTVRDMGNLQDNLDVSNVFRGVATPTSTGWLDTNDAFIGSIDFTPGQILLRGDASDFIRVRVRDDLSSMDFLRATATMWGLI